MPKVKLYLRVAETAAGRHRFAVNPKPNHAPLLDPSGTVLPTIAFAVLLDIDPMAFRSAERVITELEINMGDIVVAAEVAP